MTIRIPRLGYLALGVGKPLTTLGRAASAFSRLAGAAVGRNLLPVQPLTQRALCLCLEFAVLGPPHFKRPGAAFLLFWRAMLPAAGHHYTDRADLFDPILQTDIGLRARAFSAGQVDGGPTFTAQVSYSAAT